MPERKLTAISATRFALEALQDSGGLDDATKKQALLFLDRCQNFGVEEGNDGGFFFTPTPDDLLNKAGWSEANGSARARSYGSATADGICGLVVCGTPADDPRVLAAITWLQRHDAVDDVPRFPAGELTQVPSAQNGLRFYYYAALAKAIHGTPSADWSNRRKHLLKTVVRQQRTDGSWANPCTLMREDDPLVATSLTINAMSFVIQD